MREGMKNTGGGATRANGGDELLAAEVIYERGEGEREKQGCDGTGGVGRTANGDGVYNQLEETRDSIA